MSETNTSFMKQTDDNTSNYATLHIAICDDHAEVLTSVKNMLQENLSPMKYEVAAFTDSDTFLEHVANGQTDIAVIDIVLNDNENGIEIAKKINRTCRHTIVIFISGYTDFIEKMYEAEHLYFLKKPIDNAKLHTAISKAIQKLYGESITILRKGTIQKIYTYDIVMTESINRDIKIHLSSGEAIEYTAKLSDLEKLLPPITFLRCHKSYIINMDKILEVKNGRIFLSGDLSAPISRPYAADVKMTITKKLGGIL